MTPTARRGAIFAAALLAASYLWLALYLLPDFGLTWDASIGEHRAGEKLLAYLEDGCDDPAWLDIPAAEPKPPLRQPHPAFPDGGFALHQVSTVNSLLAALTCRVFWTELGWLPAIEAHHLANVLLTAAFVFALAYVVSRRAGWRAGAASAIALLAMPRFFTHSFNNPKDLPVALLYAAGAALTWQAMRAAEGRRRTLWWLAAGAACGVALASKANALFLPIQLGLLWLGALALQRRDGPARPRLALREPILALFSFAVAWFAVSPDLWQGPFEAARLRFEAIAAAGSNIRDDISTHGLNHVVWTTPPVILACALAGLARPGLPVDARLFLGLGIAVPIGRTLLPGTANFDGVRHFLEFAPFMACSAGLGIDWIATHAARRLTRASGSNHRLAHGIALALCIPAVAVTALTHPYGTSYYNAFVGGLAGAQRRGIPDATDYWGHSYRRGLDWLRTHAPDSSRLIVPIGGHIVSASAPVELREDIALLPNEVDAALDRSTFVMSVTRPEATPFHRAVQSELLPCFSIEVQGAPILSIWRLEAGDAAAERAWAVRERSFALDVGQAMQTLGRWLSAHPDQLPLVTLYRDGLQSDHADEVERLLRALLPPKEFDTATLDAIVWHWRND